MTKMTIMAMMTLLDDDDYREYLRKEEERRRYEDDDDDDQVTTLSIFSFIYCEKLLLNMETQYLKRCNYEIL